MINFLKVFFEKIYELFESINVPGFNISMADFYLGLLGITFSLAVLRLSFGLSSGGSSTSGGNNRRIRISKERSGDTH